MSVGGLTLVHCHWAAELCCWFYLFICTNVSVNIQTHQTQLSDLLCLVPGDEDDRKLSRICDRTTTTQRQRDRQVVWLMVNYSACSLSPEKKPLQDKRDLKKKTKNARILMYHWQVVSEMLSNAVWGLTKMNEKSTFLMTCSRMTFYQNQDSCSLDKYKRIKIRNHIMTH